MLTETYAEVSKISIFSSVASNMKSNRTAEDLTSLVPDFAVALEKVKTQFITRYVKVISAILILRYRGVTANAPC